ncbi:hypothetical protein CO180_04445 [candidate division WWE3 bacterium CG_4_9_14_3_um_filter_41_6]|uniref:Uncharacterized protein n=1 Tax=candidate division WWE3 bacterium CG_4_10_14_0_2_um_filter_41_14 TaxID=1975072 RepID=A0A2M7TF65_UNCKA|nr:MAG: hypothetical protein COY32_06320 [candidate division WWE3 bacterium CG_4_10_14_0_2_um_filter_41_14]PJA38043.1 MAG: hypothetical protein CO180_04445 [candidate division WWE3 bacterium CG_4_9_14_3_um_filter_41_6]
MRKTAIVVLSFVLLTFAVFVGNYNFGSVVLTPDAPDGIQISLPGTEWIDQKVRDISAPNVIEFVDFSRTRPVKPFISALYV